MLAPQQQQQQQHQQEIEKKRVKVHYMFYGRAVDRKLWTTLNKLWTAKTSRTGPTVQFAMHVKLFT